MNLSWERVTTELVSSKNQVLEFSSSLWAGAPLVVIGLGVLVFIVIFMMLLARSTRTTRINALRSAVNELQQSIDAARLANATAKQTLERALETERASVRDLGTQLQRAVESVRAGEEALSSLQATRQQEIDAAQAEKTARDEKLHKAISTLSSAIEILSRPGGTASASVRIAEGVTILGTVG